MGAGDDAIVLAMIADHAEAFAGTCAREVVIGAPPALAVATWMAAFPWMVQGFTMHGPGPRPFDLGLLERQVGYIGIRA